MHIYRIRTVALVWFSLLLMSTGAAAEAAQKHHKEQRYSRAQHKDYRHYQRGQYYSRLPAGYLSLRYGGLSYYYHSGDYFRRRGNDYVVINPPPGIGISILPAGYRSVYHGRHRYYVANGIFYQWQEARRRYVVVEAPQTEAMPVATTATTQFVYPRAGQNATQTSRDRYECYLWARAQTGVEPAESSGIDGSIADYQRANGACLEARGYSVK